MKVHETVEGILGAGAETEKGFAENLQSLNF